MPLDSGEEHKSSELIAVGESGMASRELGDNDNPLRGAESERAGILIGVLPCIYSE